MKRLFALLLVFLAFSLGVSAAIQKDSIKVFAVTTEGTGLSADLTLTIEKGSGKIWSSVAPLVGTSTQNAERVAKKVAENYVQDVEKYDYKFEINSTASTVEGPSAGAAMALLVISMLRNQHLPDAVGITGTISEGGGIGQVGGVFEKAKEAQRIGVKLFLIPKGEAKQIVKLPSGLETINLVDYAFKEWGMKVVEVKNIDEVLGLAFSNIEAIDVNKEAAKQSIEFVPEGIAVPEQLLPMKELTEKYVADGKTLVEEAKKALNASLLENTKIMDSLLASLNDSEETLKEAELLSDRNFLYSAANYAFLARVNAMLVKDIAENPSIISSTATIFHSRLKELEKNASELQKTLSEPMPVDGLEWQIAAQERLAWAQGNIKKLSESQTIVISTGGETDSTEADIERIQELEFAAAWLGIAADFAKIASESKAAKKPGDSMKEYSSRFLVEIENNLMVLSEEDSEDAKKRYDAALRERELGWNYAAAFDAASALALINGNKASAGKGLQELYSEMKEKIVENDKNIASSGKAMVWATLYNAHASYYLKTVQHYLDENQNSQALAAAKSGLGLAMLAESVLDASSAVFDDFEKLPTIEQKKSRGETEGQQAASLQKIVFLFLGFVGGALIVALVSIWVLKKVSRTPSRHRPEQREIRRLRQLQQKLDHALISGRLSEKKHSELEKRLEEQIVGIEGKISRSAKRENQKKAKPQKKKKK